MMQRKRRRPVAVVILLACLTAPTAQHRLLQKSWWLRERRLGGPRRPRRYGSPQQQPQHYHAYYAEQEHLKQQQDSSSASNPTHYYSSLTDVAFCLAMALGWTVWMLSSLVRSDLSRYQKDSVLVKGHVLQVSVEEDSLGTGMPTYRAVIDYMVDSPDMGAASIQVRKHFNTQNLLQQGFANVEILVIPQEPTSSVLRDDFQQQVEEHKEDEEEALIRPTWCKRLSMAFASVLVLVSLAGCVQVVVHLDPLIRWQGWILLCAGATLLLPLGLLVHRILVVLQRIMEHQSEKAGVILRGATEHVWWLDDDMLDPHGACEDEALSETAPPSAGSGYYFVEMKGDKNKNNNNNNDNDEQQLQVNLHSSSSISSLSVPADLLSRMDSVSSSNNNNNNPNHDNNNNNNPPFVLSNEMDETASWNNQTPRRILPTKPEHVELPVTTRTLSDVS